MDSSLPTSSPPSKEVLPSSPRKPKPPPYAIPDDLAQFIRERPLLKFDGGAGESDSGLCVPPSKEVLPRSIVFEEVQVSWQVKISLWW